MANSKKTEPKEAIVSEDITTELKVGESLTISAGASATALTEPKEAIVSEDLVTIICEYPKDFEGTKYMVEGQEYQVGKENAELFVEVKKIATYK